MGVVEAILVILALKIPILGLIYFVYWLMKEPQSAEPSDEVLARKMPPRLPTPGNPRRRGPHGGAALPAPSKRRDPHPAPTRRETVPAPVSRSS